VEAFVVKVLRPVLTLVVVALPLALASSAVERAQAARPVVTLTVAPDAFSPNGDHVKEIVRIAAHVDQPSRVVLDFAHQGVTIFSSRAVVTMRPKTLHFVWKGRTRLGGRGQPLPDGRYLIRATATNRDGIRATSSMRVLKDTQPPHVGWRGLSPRRTDRGPLRLRGRVSDRSKAVRVGTSLTDQTGNPLSSGRSRPEAAARFSLRWPRIGRVSLKPGAYRIALRAVDELGNVGVSSQRTFLVDRPVHARVWGRFSAVGRRVALTFDDCGSPSAWSSILHTLRHYRIKATFFCPGQQVRASPGLARRTVAARHAIGSHGWDHANFASLSYGSARARLSYDREIWWHLARVSPTPYFRPPYGAYNASTLAAGGAEGYGAIVLWDVDPRDWTSPGTATIIHRVVSHTHPGSIVLMHVLPQTAAGLPTIIRRLRAKRLKMLTLPELARIGAPSPGGWKSF